MWCGPSAAWRVDVRHELSARGSGGRARCNCRGPAATLRPGCSSDVTSTRLIVVLMSLCLSMHCAVRNRPFMSPQALADPDRAAALPTHAADAFPEFIAIRLVLARAQEMNGEFAGALASFDHVLALKLSHVDAPLGRVRTLNYLGCGDDAIAAATVLIDRVDTPGTPELFATLAAREVAVDARSGRAGRPGKVVNAPRRAEPTRRPSPWLPDANPRDARVDTIRLTIQKAGRFDISHRLSEKWRLANA